MILGYFGYIDPLYYLLALPGMALAMWAQWRVSSAFNSASQMPASSGITGADAARMILNAHNINDVGIEPAPGGQLSDHYDPKSRMLRLSRGVYDGHSVAALGIAAHEAGHAIQDKTGYKPLALRNGIVPLAAVGPNLAFVLFFIGMFISAVRGPFAQLGFWCVVGGIALFSVFVLFQLINLPVELDASRRAKDLLKSSGLVAQGQEARAMSRVLNAAAWTYVAATLSAILTLLYFLIRSGLLGGSRRD